MRKHICEAIFNDSVALIRCRRADALFHLRRSGALIRLSAHRYRIHNVLGNLVRGLVGHPVTFTPAFDLPIMAASHNCQHIDIVVTLRVVSGRQSPPVFKSRSPVCLVRTCLLWRLLCHQQMGSPQWAHQSVSFSASPTKNHQIPTYL